MRRWIALGLGAAALAGCGERPLPDGRRVFLRAGCGGCHTTKAAGTHGSVGPNFDTSERLSRRQIRNQLEVGSGGMPSFRHRLTAREEAAVTEFVYRVLHRRR